VANRALVAGLRRRQSEIQAAFDYVHSMTEGEPAVVLGDFNMEPNDEWFRALISREGMTDVLGQEAPPTWDPLHNFLSALSTSFEFPSGQHKTELDIISAVYDRIPKRVDYILMKSFPDSSSVINAQVIPPVTSEGVWFSDHSAVMAEVDG
jgi:endonuclease/exonuclease/phosphatase family metal-dependent hydrolase